MSFHIIILLSSGLFGLASTECTFNLQSYHEGKTPIALTLCGNIINPSNRNGDVVLQNDEKIQLLCSGGGNYLLNANIGRMANVTCVLNKFRLNDDSHLYDFESLKCRRHPLPSIREAGNCHGSLKRINIGFDAVNFYVSSIYLCFDPVKYITYWTAHILKTSDYSCSASASTSFKKDYYPSDIQNIYQRYAQYETGHLSPRCDFFTGPERRMTFYYINSSPQIKQFNGGNWRRLEADIRTAANNKGKHLEIYTGTAKSVQSMTSGRTTIPVQLYFWKIVVDRTNGNGVAFVGINNVQLRYGCPCRQEVNCQQINWLSTNFLRSMVNVSKGLIYCCTVQSLTSNADFITPFSNFGGGLLTDL